MRGVTLKSRATAFACAAGALVFTLSLVLGYSPDQQDDLNQVGRALIIAILCGTLSWASTSRSMAATAAAVDTATERLLSAAHGDLQSPVSPNISAELPDLSVAMQSLFSQVRTNLDHVQSLALFDQVTGLANRTSFCRQVERHLTGRNTDAMAALFFIDLDGFKGVNDSLGHAAGDQLLARVAGRLREVVMAQVSAGTGDAVIGRLAGDEFTMFFPFLPGPSAAARIARAVQFALSERFDLGSQHVELGASIGIACYPDHGDTLSALLRAADVAMYHAKHQGRGRAEIYSSELALEAADRAELERDLLLALQRDEFLLEFQPQIDVISGQAVAAEALVRWAHPERDLVMPGTFVPVAEESGTIVALGDWVMSRVCETAARWAEAGQRQRIAINISTRELAQADFFMRLRHAMATHRTPASMLALEITESVAMNMEPRILDQLAAMRTEGLHIAIDDFGTGYSNLARLRELPVDRVKIDRSLVRDIASSAEARTICSAVVGLIQGLGMEVVIEGVENEAQMDVLRVIGCTLFQGYHLARPMDEQSYLTRFAVPLIVQERHIG
ncbi:MULTISPECIES: putative bifunctional diguanylate cyclase/phosphodiesterase [Sphingobium]|jgi:diguanylate cyclase|uniref:putative bifunctional diguanylate cyclase/phosphodiesterase n=1 Tax=Sphingobium TaxID=165695 RepID=UPI000C3BAE2C|nr:MULTISPECIES: EAL domain-containing protein [Sphingobium]MAX15126.1 GGDEF-domain containing protein [Sphingobium sp.]MBS48073.1 GGDEF-domain containing protein [Sphingobium sp.]MCC4255452.1 EAL domain-containing protein [Sphingobium lactosutens]MEC9018186.1 EAL domain-containing protein [Pseudomonadota bacterium]|tara:strand:+ start:579 stop:2264 length:1686 start_codon:yes stop_codon:yes gene_type:complete